MAPSKAPKTETPDAIGHQLYTVSWVKLAGAACIISHLLPPVITIPKTLPSIAINSVSRKSKFRMYADDAPNAFSIHISRVLSSTAVYMAIVTTMKPTTRAMPITTPMKSRNSPTLLIVNSEVNSSIV